MARILDPLLVCTYLLIAAVPLAGTITHTPGVQLFGALPEVTRPTWSARSFASEDYQKELTHWFEQSLGFRGVSVHADNTVLFHAFRETKPGLGIIIGRQDVLFERDDVGSYNALIEELPPPAAVEAYAEKVAWVQRRLAADGRAFVPLMIPSKLSLYRDELPARWQTDVGPEPRPYERGLYRAYQRAFDARGVRYTDVRRIFAASSEPREVLWGVEARHWSHYAACFATRDILAQRTALTGKPAPDYPCVLERRPDATSADFDLFRLLNAWFLHPANRSTPVAADPEPSSMPGDAKPSLLFVGTSFMGMVAHDALRSGAFRELHSFWYNSVYADPYPHGPEVKVVPHTPQWRQIVAKDIVVIDLFEPYMSPQNVIAEFVEQLRVDLVRADSDR